MVFQDSCTYAGTKLCLNDHYLCETFCLGWTIHQCNNVGINSSTSVNWALTPAGLDANIWHCHQRLQTPESSLPGVTVMTWVHRTCSLPCQCHLRDKVWSPAMPNLTAGPSWGNNQWTACYDSYIMWLYFIANQIYNLMLSSAKGSILANSCWGFFRSYDWSVTSVRWYIYLSFFL